MKPPFILWAPKAKNASLFFPQKNFEIELTPLDRGYWTTNEWKRSDGDQYLIVIDGERLPDPKSLFQPDGITGPSQVFDATLFQWTDDKWTNPALDHYIIYELHTGTFSSTGTFAGISERLPYLKDLGITAIEIMPVAQFPGGRNWGYDGVFPFAVQNTYGGPRALQQLVDDCHRHGIAVVLDVVMNHVGPEGNNFQKFGPYFTDKYKTPWGEAINFDDAGSDAVRQFFIENILMWFRDFHIDAIRLDAVHAIRDFSAKHILAEISENVDELQAATNRQHYLIAECDLNDAKYIRPLENSGHGMDAQWIDEFHHALRVAVGQERNGYYSDFNGVEDLAKAYSSAYVYDGVYSPHRDRTFGSSANDLPGSSFVVFSQNHDQVGNRMLGERTSSLLSVDQLKLLATAVFVSPYIPLLFMGEEYGETNPFLYFISHESKELIEAVRNGRRKEFEHFFSGDDFPDPYSEDIFNQSKLSWSIDDRQRKELLSFYKELIRLRKTIPALKTLDRSALSVSLTSGKDGIKLFRKHHDGDVVVLLNFSKEDQDFELPRDRSWKTLMSSAKASIMISEHV